MSTSIAPPLRTLDDLRAAPHLSSAELAQFTAVQRRREATEAVLPE